MVEKTPTLAYIEALARKAGEAILPLYGSTGVKYSKVNKADVVTEADLISNKIITDAIRADFPSHTIVSEEEANRDIEGEWTWLIDPLDGTRNFSTGTPLWGIIIGVAHKGNMEFGVSYLPVLNEFISAQHGKGAFMNGKQIHCSKETDLALTYGSGASGFSEKKVNFMLKLSEIDDKHAMWVNALGCGAASASFVASGRRDWMLSSGGGMWDYAAHALILEEAGCTVTTEDGSEWKLGDSQILAANKSVHKQLLAVLKKAEE